MLDATSPDDALDPHIVGRIEKRHWRPLPRHKAVDVARMAGVSARKAMLAELPDISVPAHHRGSQPLAFDGVCGIQGVLLEIDRDLVDLYRLEASNGNVQSLLDEELGELRKLDVETLPIPAGIFGDLVIGQ